MEIGTRTCPVEAIELKMSTKVVAFKETSDSNFNFSWACRPILRFIRLIAIPLTDVRDTTSRFPSFTAIAIAATFYVMHIIFNIINITKAIRIERDRSQNSTDSMTSTMNAYIFYFNYAICTFMGHSGLLFITSLNWNGLIQAFRQMESLRTFQVEEYRRFRYASLIGLAFISVVSLRVQQSCKSSISNTALSFQEVLIQGGIHIMTLLTEETIFHQVQDVVLFVAQLYPFSGVILFCSLGQMVCIMLRHFRRRIEAEKAGRKVTISWKRFYIGINQIVDRFNDCFGFNLLIFTTSLFIRIISNTFYALLDFRNDLWTPNAMAITLALLTKDLVYLVTYTVIASRMNHEVMSIEENPDPFCGVNRYN